jgi:hypothetical protein
LEVAVALQRLAALARLPTGVLHCYNSFCLARFLDFTLCHRARVFLTLDRPVALGLQLVVSLPLVLGRRRDELGRMAQRITALKNCLNDLRRQELCSTLRCWSASYREQSVEELSVAFKGDSKILGGRFFTATPLLFEARTRLGEAVCQLFDHIRHQAVRLLDAVLGVVDEAGLDIDPPRAKFGKLVIGEKRSFSG